MMTSPEGYYATHLRGKTKNQIMRHIYKLRSEIKRLKIIMENPDYKETMDPSAGAWLSCTREYLEQAKRALIEVGGTYTLSKDEKIAERFDDRIPKICNITFSIGSYFRQYDIYTIVVDEDGASFYMNHSFSQQPSNLLGELYEVRSKNHFLREIQYLHLGEWHKNYENANITDGTEWELSITYSDGHEPFKSGGYNAYPYNFEVLLSIIKLNRRRIET